MEECPFFFAALCIKAWQPSQDNCIAATQSLQNLVACSSAQKAHSGTSLSSLEPPLPSISFINTASRRSLLTGTAHGLLQLMQGVGLYSSFSPFFFFFFPFFPPPPLAAGGCCCCALASSWSAHSLQKMQWHVKTTCFLAPASKPPASWGQ